jgi:hypothetical protein
LAISGWLLLFSVLCHFPRIFFIADESSRLTHQESLLANYPGLCKWDCGFYHYFAGQADLSTSHQFAAFFPLFPLILSGLHRVFPALALGSLSIVASNLFSVLAVALLVLLGRALWGRASAGAGVLGFGRPALLLGLAVAVYPHSQFFSYGYSEPLFCCLYATALWAMFRERWDVAAALCGLASVTRPQGLWLLGAFLLVCGWRAMEERKATGKLRWSAVAIPLATLVPFGVFLVWQRSAFGNPFEFLVAQARWGRHFDFWAGLSCNLPKFDQSRIFAILAIVSAASFFRRPGAQWKFLALVTLMMSEIPLFLGGFFSYPRFSALNLGVFIFLVELARERLWLILVLLILAVTRLDVEVYNWMTSVDFIF